MPTARRFAAGDSPWPPAVGHHPHKESLTRDPVLRRMFLEAGISELQLQPSYSSEQLLQMVEERVVSIGPSQLVATLGDSLSKDELLGALHGATFSAVCTTTGGTPLISMPAVERHLAVTSALVLDPELRVADARTMTGKAAWIGFALSFPKLDDIPQPVALTDQDQLGCHS